MAKYKKRADGRYQAYLDIGHDDNGKRIRKVIYAHTISEMEEKLLKAKVERQSGCLVNSPEMYLEEYALIWLKTYKNDKRTNTIAMYSNIIDKHIIPALGHFKLKDIKRSDIQMAISERKEHYRICEQFRLTLKQIFESAIDDKLLASNPCTKIVLPDKPRSNKRALTDIEKEAIKKADFSDRERAFIYLIYFFGLRREEALAVISSDFDFKKRTLRINKAIVFDKNIGKLEATKNNSSDRMLPIPDSVIPFFKEYISKLDSLYLITKLDGGMMTQSSYVKMWNQITKKMNDSVATEQEKKLKIKPITGLTAHIFRHNYATMLYYSGISIKKAAQLMGHSNTKMIMDVYAHLDDEKENVVDRINNMMVL